MASSSDIEAGKAYVRLAMKDNEYHSAIGKAKRAASDLGAKIGSIGAGALAAGAAIVTPLAGAVASFVEMGGALDDMSQRTGVAVGKLAELKYAAEVTGSSAEDLEAALRNMAKKGMDVGDFEAVAARIAAIENPSQQAAAAMDVFGKSGANLLPMLRELKSHTADARGLGIVPKAEDVAAAASLGEAFDKLSAVAKAAVFNIGAAIAPLIEPAVATITGIVGNISAWIQANHQVAQTIAMIGAGLVAFGSVAVAAGGALIGMGTAVSAVAAGVSALLSPVALTVAACAALAAAVVGAAFAIDYLRNATINVEGPLGAFLRLMQTLAKVIYATSPALWLFSSSKKTAIEVTENLTRSLQGATDGFIKQGRAAMQAAADTAQLTRQLEEARLKAEEMHRATEAAERRRAALIREFETPKERFARKDAELRAAIKEVDDKRRAAEHRGPRDAALRELAALEEARRRLHAGEAERRRREADLKKPPVIPEPKHPKPREVPEESERVFQPPPDIGFNPNALVLNLLGGLRVGAGGAGGEAKRAADELVAIHRELKVHHGALLEIARRVGGGGVKIV